MIIKGSKAVINCTGNKGYLATEGGNISDKAFTLSNRGRSRFINVRIRYINECKKKGELTLKSFIEKKQ